MILKLLRFIAITSIAVAMAGGLAHAFEFRQKMALTREEYLVVQQIYRGWALLGIPILCGLVLSLGIAYLVRSHRLGFSLTLVAAISLGLQLVIFFTFTQPANRATKNWTTLPENWETLRVHWEYSHLASAGLFVVAFLAMTLSVFVAPFAEESRGVRTDRVYRGMFR